ncbi:radical SAM protein [Ferruginibacter yonginensis]|uniref:Radical SAM protein n=1 Tax=Ferruginibacter yonginensis TaxID=1310416 RepID=A0ABV8QSQ6_9BACT
MNNFNHYESVYWVFTQLCNDQCDHCYNSSGPQGARLSEEECMAIVDNLPEKIDRLILSGGEPLAEKKLLFNILDKLQLKYKGATQIMLQTNGDLLTGDILDTLVAKGVTRIDIASIDRYHKKAGARLDVLKELLFSRGFTDENATPLIEKETYLQTNKLTFGYWGASEEMWLGGNWARGRAMEKNIWLKNPNHNFCKILSGAKGFLGGTDLPMEISIQLWKINPCCPGTKFPLGDARVEKVSDVITRVSKMEVFQALNEGEPWKMGAAIGIDENTAKAETEALQNICLYCDSFFARFLDAQTLALKATQTVK